MAKKRQSHDFDRSTHPPGTPVLHRPGEAPEVRDHPDLRKGFGDLSVPISSSRDPRPSTFPVDLASAPTDVQTGASVAQRLRTIGVPPTSQDVKTESSGGPSYLRHGR